VVDRVGRVPSCCSASGHRPRLLPLRGGADALAALPGPADRWLHGG
jgi:hypothetical protein